MDIRSFRIAVPQDVLDDLHHRLARTRWPDEVEGADWDYGTNLSYMRELVGHWQSGFDWRRQEGLLNRTPQFRAKVDGVGVHFLLVRGTGERTTPLLLLHGWPSTFWQMIKLLPLLTDPTGHGGSASDAFDVVVPSLPGYGFSDRYTKRGMTVPRMAYLLTKLMTEGLGHRRYAIRGSDIGAGVAMQMALGHPDKVVGLHLSGSNPYIGEVPGDATEAERAFVRRSQEFIMAEGAYGMVQSTKPQTLAYGLNDSPVGLAAWIVEKFRSWSDCHGQVEERFSKDDLLTNITIYWVTGTINSSIRTYYESRHGPWPGAGQRVEVPTAMAMFPRDLPNAPREWEERTLNLRQWTEMPRGGHFGEWEEPELLAQDIREFFRPMRT